MNEQELRAALAEIRDGIDGEGRWLHGHGISCPYLVHGSPHKCACGERLGVRSPRPISENLPVVEAWILAQAGVLSYGLNYRVRDKEWHCQYCAVPPATPLPSGSFIGHAVSANKQAACADAAIQAAMALRWKP